MALHYAGSSGCCAVSRGGFCRSLVATWHQVQWSLAATLVVMLCHQDCSTCTLCIAATDAQHAVRHMWAAMLNLWVQSNPTGKGGRSNSQAEIQGWSVEHHTAVACSRSWQAPRGHSVLLFYAELARSCARSTCWAKGIISSTP